MRINGFMDIEQLISDQLSKFDPSCYEDIDTTLRIMSVAFRDIIEERGFRWGDDYEKFITDEEFKYILTIE